MKCPTCSYECLEDWNACPKCRAELKQKCFVCGEQEPIGSPVCQKELNETREKVDEYFKQEKKRLSRFAEPKNALVLIGLILFFVFFASIFLSLTTKFNFFSVFTLVFLATFIPLIFLAKLLERRIEKAIEKAKERAMKKFKKDFPKEAEILEKGEAQ